MRTGGKILLLVLSAVMLLAVTELLLQLTSREKSGYYLWRPFMKSVLQPDPKYLPGINGASRFIVNSKGVRGDEPSVRADYSILAIGGSTTECLYLDQQEAWPALVQSKLNSKLAPRRVWLGNAGKSGMTTREHILHMQRLLPSFSRLDALLFLVGYNDLGQRLSKDIYYDANFMERPDALQSLTKRAFAIYPLDDQPLLKRTILWQRLRRLKWAYFLDESTKRKSQNITGAIYDQWRTTRQRSTLHKDRLPDLTEALAEYKKNLETIVTIARERKLRPIFMTQPVMWQDKLPVEQEELLWGGGIGSFPEAESYYTTRALAEGMQKYNAVLLESCAALEVECFDLTGKLARDTTVFYDDRHFNESGAKQLADLVVDYLINREPLQAATADVQEKSP